MSSKLKLLTIFVCFVVALTFGPSVAQPDDDLPTSSEEEIQEVRRAAALYYEFLEAEANAEHENAVRLGSTLLDDLEARVENEDATEVDELEFRFRLARQLELDGQLDRAIEEYETITSNGDFPLLVEHWNYGEDDEYRLSADGRPFDQYVYNQSVAALLRLHDSSDPVDLVDAIERISERDFFADEELARILLDSLTQEARNWMDEPILDEDSRLSSAYDDFSEHVIEITRIAYNPLVEPDALSALHNMAQTDFSSINADPINYRLEFAKAHILGRKERFNGPATSEARPHFDRALELLRASELLQNDRYAERDEDEYELLTLLAAMYKQSYAPEQYRAFRNEFLWKALNDRSDDTSDRVYDFADDVSPSGIEQLNFQTFQTLFGQAAQDICPGLSVQSGGGDGCVARTNYRLAPELFSDWAVTNCADNSPDPWCDDDIDESDPSRIDRITVEGVRRDPKGHSRDDGLLTIELYYGTTRRPTGQSKPKNYYSGLPDYRRDVPGYRGTISVLADTRKLGRPTFLSAFDDGKARQKYLEIGMPAPISPSAFKRKLAQASSAAESKIAFIFVHGFNVDFEGAAKSAAQIAYDLDFRGVPMFYSWPAGGHFYDYFSDNEIWDLAVDDLSQFINTALEDETLETVHIIAHSMGGRYVHRALDKLHDQRGANGETKLGELVFIAPDIDQREFIRASRVKKLNEISDGVTLYASRKDKALKLSKTFRLGQRRAGDATNLALACGIRSIDASNVPGDLFSHSYYARSRAVLIDLKANFSSPRVPETRRCYLSMSRRNSIPYWSVMDDTCDVHAFAIALGLLERLTPEQLSKDLESYFISLVKDQSFWNYMKFEDTEYDPESEEDRSLQIGRVVGTPFAIDILNTSLFEMVKAQLSLINQPVSQSDTPRCGN